jgi:hypothetical protein
MMVLVVFLIPLAFAYFLSGRPETERYPGLIAFGTGIVGGILAAFIDSLAGLTGFMWLSGFVSRFLLALASEIILPFAIGILPFFLLSVAPLREKLSLVRSQLFGLAAVFLPYRMLVRYDVPDAWAVTLIPAMALAVLFLTDFFIGRLLGRVSGNPDALDMLQSALPVIVALVALVASTMLWFLCFPIWSYGILSLAVVASALFLRIVKYYR